MLEFPAPAYPYGRNAEMGQCKRRGYCCQDVRLAESPDMLRTAYEFWKKSAKIDPNFSEIYLIFPMLKIICTSQITRTKGLHTEALPSTIVTISSMIKPALL